MNKRLVVVAVIAVGSLLRAVAVEACGDKFVLIGRGARVARAKYPSSILIFMNPASRIPAAEKEFHVEAILKAAGHKARVAENEAEVRREVESGKYDLVLADVTDVPALRREAGATSAKPAVIPILYEPTPAELAAAEKDASCLVRPSKKSRDLLAVVDDAMRDRRKGTGSMCAPAP